MPRSARLPLKTTIADAARLARDLSLAQIAPLPLIRLFHILRRFFLRAQSVVAGADRVVIFIRIAKFADFRKLLTHGIATATSIARVQRRTFSLGSIAGFRFAQRVHLRHTLYIDTLRYEWDENKNHFNQRKHDGISFELASLVFEDEHCLVYPDRIDNETGERRWHAIGSVQIDRALSALLLVVHVYRETRHGEEIIRILSARAAEKRDIRRYQAQTMD